MVIHNSDNVVRVIDDVIHTLRDLQQETSNLRLEAASLSNPERIERVARKELNLRLPSAEQVITVN